MDIQQLSANASNGDLQPYFEYLRSTMPRAQDMEFDLECHPAACSMGAPITVHYQCDGKYHNHPDQSWAACAPYVSKQGGGAPTLHMLCSACSYKRDPLGFED